MDPEIGKLIRETQSKTGKGIPFRLNNDGARIELDPKLVNNFMYSYCNIIDKRRGPFYVAEIVSENQPIPLVVEGIFEYNEGTKMSMGEQDRMILLIIFCYQRVIEDTITLSETRSELIAVRLDRIVNSTRPAWNYRIQFPYCRLDDELRLAVRAQVLITIQNHNILGTMPSAPRNGWDTIISSAPITHLTMFRSSTKIGVDPLDFTEVYGPLTMEMINGDDEIYRYPKGGLITLPLHSFLKEIPEGVPCYKDEVNFQYWLPVFLSIYYGHTRVISKSSANSSSANTPAGNLRVVNKFGPDDWVIAKDMLDMLSATRAQNEFYFNDVGRALYNSCHGSTEGLTEWIAFGKKHEVFTEPCADLYPKFEGSWITAKSLRFYARADSPDAYDRWLQNYRRSIMDLAAGGRHAHVAEALYETYCLDFCSAFISNNGWYHYSGHHWTHIDKGYEFSKHITKQFCYELEKHRADIINRQMHNDDRSEKEILEGKIKKLTALMDKLADNRYKTAVMAESLNYFYDPKFSSRYDNAPHLLCVRTGVIEMNEKTFLFRPGKPEDYLTLTTGVAYNDKLDSSNRSVLRALVWIEQLMVQPELIIAMQNFMGSIPYGGNLDKKVMIWTGPPDGGKSSFTRAINLALGEYAIKGENNVLYNNRSGDGPSPSLARIRGTRMQFYEELETERGVISSGFIKRATGNDTFFARRLHENGGEIDPLNKTVMVCNLVPQFSTFDQATKERVYIMPFGSRWVENPPASAAEQKQTRTFKRDRQFNSQIPEYAVALLWLMINWYPRYMQDGLPKPVAVTNVNEKYWADCDYYYRFREDNMHRYLLPDGTADRKFTLEANTAYAEFKKWFKMGFQNNKMPNIQVFKNGMKEKLGDLEGGRWIGWGLLNTTPTN